MSSLFKACRRNGALWSMKKQLPSKRLPTITQISHFSPPHHHAPRRLFRAPFLKKWTRRAVTLAIGIGAFSYFMDADFITYFYDLYRTKYDTHGMKGKTIWIVGASSGIGEYLAYELVESGAKRIILSARRVEHLKRVKEECQQMISQLNKQQTDESIQKINTRIQRKIDAAIHALKEGSADTVNEDTLSEIRQQVHNRYKSELENAKSSTDAFVECDIIIQPLDMMEFAQNPGSADTFVETLMQDLDARFVSESERGGFHVEPSDIDILVINSGRTQKSFALQNTQSILLYLQQLNVFAPIALSQAMCKYWIQNINDIKINRKSKKLHQIAVTSSLAGLIGSPKMSAYSMSKGAILKYMEAMRMELADDKIDINLVCPGPVSLTGESHASLGNDIGAKQRSRYEGRVGTDMPLERCASLYTTALQYSITESWPSPNPALLFVYLRQYVPILLGPMSRFIGAKYAALGRDQLYISEESEEVAKIQ